MAVADKWYFARFDLMRISDVRIHYIIAYPKSSK